MKKENNIEEIKNRYKTNNYASHQPVLEHILKMIKGPILELGCGEGSTELIHYYSKLNNNTVLTIESDLGWMNNYLHLKDSTHDFLNIKNFKDWQEIIKNKKWGLVFIDQGDWNSRYESLINVKKNSEYIILHDSCYYPKNNIFGTITDEKNDYICAANDRCHCKNIVGKKVDYSDIFLYHKEYISPYGPPTLLGSDNNQVDHIEITMG